MLLNEIINTEKIAHAYLFLGADKRELVKQAVEFAKALNCSNETNTLKACNSCISCNKIEHFNHPDVWHIKAESAAASPQIKIEQIRKLQSEAYLKATEATKKVFIIYDADALNPEASNCLLKILEEPPKDVVIVLVSAHLGSLLPTIISRCHIIRFNAGLSSVPDSKDKELIEEFLNARDQFSAGELKFVKSPKAEQLKVIDMLLTHFRDILVNDKAAYAPESILALMNQLFKAKDLLQSNVNSKLVADLILDNIISLKRMIQT